MRLDWDDTWSMVARDFGAARSACDRRQVGAIIVDACNQVQATTYNGPPAGLQIPNLDAGCLAWCPYAQQLALGHPYMGSYANCPSLHAEANALLQADRSKIEGGTIYVSSAVCKDCAKLIANSGLVRVVMDVWPDDAHRNPDQVAAYLRECGLECVANHLTGRTV